MSADRHSEKSSDIIMGNAVTIPTHSGDYRDQSAATNESRHEVDVTEMPSLTTQLDNLSIASVNPAGRRPEPPKGVHRDVADSEKGFWAVSMIIAMIISVSQQNHAGTAVFYAEPIILFDIECLSPHSRQRVAVAYLALH
ncbi:hypothetical protein FDENT_8599 [Fusarium denticulatum]|uniref:Uncharacterized protein n=1 Tax=Fusarium denticulatum TaxID=48507 RepID=A0A8H5TWZ7_9HYPO|nr:hypothetical protein FDENT_8599 [Fusarium denticulatum]